MNIVLIIVGVILFAIGALFTARFSKIAKAYVKSEGRVVDSKKVEPNGRMPGGYAAVCEYQIGKKRIKGQSLVPAKVKYTNGYKLKLFYDKQRPTQFIVGTYFTAMKVYCIALPVGLVSLIGGIIWTVLK